MKSINLYIKVVDKLPRKQYIKQSKGKLGKEFLNYFQ